MTQETEETCRARETEAWLRGPLPNVGIVKLTKSAPS